ncbi:MAG: TadE/TadG family type IV pilus assembly protein [Actinomycetes bacterium]
MSARRSRSIPQPLSASDRGAAAADFVLVGSLLTLIFAALLQLALVLHVRNTLIAAAAEGARAAAVSGDADVGRVRTEAVAREALSGTLVQGVTVDRVVSGSVPLVQVEVTARLPLVGLLGVPRALSVTGSSVMES